MKLLSAFVCDSGIVSTDEYQSLRKACIEFERKFGITLWVLVQSGINTPFALTHLDPDALETYLRYYPRRTGE